jgi:hypothetical protein
MITEAKNLKLDKGTAIIPVLMENKPQSPSEMHKTHNSSKFHKIMKNIKRGYLEMKSPLFVAESLFFTDV